MSTQNQVIEWLLESDPSLRWQVFNDIMDISASKIQEEREKTSISGRAADLLSEQADSGVWDLDSRFPEMDVLNILYILTEMGIDPESKSVKEAIKRVEDNVLWLMNINKQELPNDEDISWWRNPFFDGEVEPCINGRVLKVGAYFGINMQPLVDRLLQEQMVDGGWNCDQERGSIRGSFHTTINVLEGLLEFEKTAGISTEISTARKKGEKFLLKRHLFKRLSTGEPITEVSKEAHDWTTFSFPYGWRYDILRGMDYLRKANIGSDARMTDAIDILTTNMDKNGKWQIGTIYEDQPLLEEELKEGKPSKWITLRAMRVLRWYENRMISFDYR